MAGSATVLNLASIIAHRAKLTPQAEAIVFGETRLSYGMLHALSNRVAHALVKMGIGHGDKVALMCPNLPYFPIVYYGIMKAGAAVVPLNVLFKPREIAYHLRDSDAKAIFAFEGTPELDIAHAAHEAFEEVESCEHFVVMTTDPAAHASESNWRTLTQITFDESDQFPMYPTAPDDTCAILYTSGTTGQPKGAELTHLNLWSNVTTTFQIHISQLNYEDGGQKTALITLPLFHTTGQTVQMNVQLYAGHRCVLLPRFDPKATYDAMAKEKVNFWVGVPTMYWALLHYINENGLDVAPIRDNMKVASSGGAPMPVELMKQCMDAFGIKICEGYGLSETSPLACFNHMERESRIGTVGQAILGVDVACFDDEGNEVERGKRGEVVIRGANVMKGYYKRPEATAEAIKNGWFYTGDVGIMDADGYLQIVDRKKDMILRGGYNVYPRELEEVIITHPAVSLVAVIGVPDERLGEEVKAVVVLKPGNTLTETEFTEWCKTQFAANKYPRYVEFRDSLPIGGTGKILKRALREELS